MTANKFAHMNYSQFASSYLMKTTNSRSAPVSSKRMTLPNARPSAASVDWVAAGKVTPIRDQQQCGEGVELGCPLSFM